MEVESVAGAPPGFAGQCACFSQGEDLMPSSSLSAWSGQTAGRSPVPSYAQTSTIACLHMTT